MEGLSYFWSIRRILGPNFEYVKKYEIITRKLVRTINRRSFLLRCRATGILPNFTDRRNHKGVQNLWHKKDYVAALQTFKLSALNIEIEDCITELKFLSTQNLKVTRLIRNLNCI